MTMIKKLLFTTVCAILGSFVWLVCVHVLIKKEVAKILGDQEQLVQMIQEAVREVMEEDAAIFDEKMELAESAKK